MHSKILWSFIFLGIFQVNGFAQKLDTELPNAKPKTNSASYYTIKTPLIPQKGNFSCWAATLQMLDSKNSGSINKENTAPIRTDSLSKYLNSYKSDRYARVSEPGWGKIKEHLAANKGLVTYKYFNEKFAHVFLVRGFQEADDTQWLIVNDPWPVGKAKITALAFNQFIRPFNGNQEYVAMNYSASSKSTSLKSEPVFNIFSSSSLKETLPVIYSPPLVKVDPKKFKNIRSKHIENLISLQIELFKNFDANLYQEMKIEYNPTKDALTKDMNSLLTLNQFTNTVSFLKYDLKASTKSDYIFDGLKLAFINANKNRKPVINITVEYEPKSSNPYLYVSRFEKYSTSERAEWDKIKREFEQALENETIASILNGTTKQPLKTRKGPADYFNIPIDDNDYEIEDISMLPLFGGMVYSFTWPPFDEKIVADPHRQMRLKPRRDAIFVSETGTPYYRLSAIGIPDWGELISKTSPIAEEWETLERDSFFNENKPSNPSKKPKTEKDVPDLPIEVSDTIKKQDVIPIDNVPVEVPNHILTNTQTDIEKELAAERERIRKLEEEKKAAADKEKQESEKKAQEEKKKAEEQLRIEAAKKKAEEEKKKLEEQLRIEAAKKKAEEEKKKLEEQLRIEAAKKKAEEEKKKAEEQLRIEAAKKKAEEEKKKAEAEKERQRKLDEEKKKAEAAKQQGTKG